MTQLLVCLRFHCHECEEGIHLKVHCSGEGLKAGPRVVAAVQVACPACRTVNEVCFRPTGEVVVVLPAENPSRLPLPSLN
ncbi:MAG: hypothetical protein NZM31_07195 [Gemmatales bacterium]|nr:hypothetical protein [Gemmatales bacterium]MDW8386784.1 hypothetical protein [Gemmatales bacterium]